MEHFPLAERLHSDVLEEKYGPVHAEVLRHDGSIRESYTADQTGVARSYNLTFLSRPMPRELSRVNEEIHSGHLIGKAFRQHGYAIRKNVLDVSVLKTPEWLRSAFRTGESFCKARLAEFYARKEGSMPLVYGTVLEVYSPDFRPPFVNSVDISQVSAVTDALETEGFSKEDVWERIGRGNDWGDVQERHLRATKASLPLVLEYRRRAQRHLKSRR